MLLLFALDSFATAFVSVMMDVKHLEDLSPVQLAVKVFLILKATAATIVAALTTIVNKLAKDELPFPNSGGERTTTETVRAETVIKEKQI